MQLIALPPVQASMSCAAVARGLSGAEGPAGNHSGGGRPGGVASAAVRTGLADVVGLVAANAAAVLDCKDRWALRLLCRAMCEALDASRPRDLTISAGDLPGGGKRALARFFGRPGCSLPASLSIIDDCMAWTRNGNL